MPIYTGTCTCGCRDFVDHMGEYECTECGEIYTINHDDATMDEIFDDIDDIFDDEEDY